MKKNFFTMNHIKEHERRQAANRERMGFRDFLIHRFLVILLFVVISEYMINSILERIFIPAIQSYFLDNRSWDASLSMTEVWIFLGILLLEILLTAIHNVVPPMLRNGIKAMIQNVDDFARRNIPGMEQNTYNMEMEAMEVFLLCLMIVAVILFFLTPLIIAALWFSRIVMDEVRRINRNKEELRREYEKKRNLMLSDIAHDLRTPITTIAGYSRALNDGMVTDEEKKREYLEAIENKSERMSDLINLLFDYVKMDSAGFELKKETVDLTELLRENAALLYSDVEEKEMLLEVSIPEERCMVELDTLQFSRVITNLISNAIRHNEKGTVITFKMVREGNTVTVVVSDNGAEIEKDVADHIFEPFIVGDASRKSKGGSGLGLSIAKRIIVMHGWTLELRQNDPEYKKAFIINITL